MAPKNNPYITIIIPIANHSDSQLLNKVLKSISRQTYKRFETLVLIGVNADPKLFNILEKFPKTKVIRKTMGKAEAQNFAALKAKGKFLLMHDADSTLKPNTLKELISYPLKNSNSPIWLPRRFQVSNNYWIVCRNFDFSLYDKSPETFDARFIKKDLFLKIGGYDPQFEPLDDWSLLIKLKKLDIPVESLDKPAIIAHESTNLLNIVKQKYKRGKAFGLIKKLHPEIFSANCTSVWDLYKDNLSLFLTNIHLLPGLFVIKLVNIIPLYLGSLIPNLHDTNFYKSKEVARDFEKKGLDTNYGRYKHYCETVSIKKLLPTNKRNVLEVGAGTGRITQLLLNEGFKVTATEPASAMLKYYNKKSSLPKPLKVPGESLPFKNKSYNLAVSIRVLWHIRSRTKQQKFIKEICRISSDSIILDITNKKRYSNPLLKIPSWLLSKIFGIHLNFDQTHLFDLRDFEKQINKFGFEVIEKSPLEVTTPFWLNYLDNKSAKTFFPLFYKLDLKISSFIPPGRLLLKLKRIKS